MSCCDAFLRGGLIFVLTLLNLLFSAFGVLEVLLGGYVAVSNSQVDTLSALLIVSGFLMSLLPTFMHQHYRSTCFSILYIIFLSLMISEELFLVAGYVHPATRNFVRTTISPPPEYINFVDSHTSALVHVTTILCLLQFWTLVLVIMLLRIKDSDEYKTSQDPDEEEEFLVMGMQHPSYNTYDDDDVEEVFTPSSSRSSKKKNKNSGIWSSFIVSKD
jgi:hypothetical protein